MADDADRVKRVTDRVRKHLTGMMLTPKDMNKHDVEDVEAAQGKRDVLEPSESESTRGAGHAALQEPQEQAAADLAPLGDGEKADTVHYNNDVHVNPISKSKHFRAIVDAYRKTK